MPHFWELLIFVIDVIVILVAIPGYIIYLLVKNRKENIRSRPEVGKLADELEKEQNKKQDKSN